MRCKRPAFAAHSLFGVLLLASGCYGPNMSPYGGYNNPYGTPYGPGMPGAPVQTLQPGGTYTPYGQPYGQPVPGGTVYPQSSPQPTIDPTGGNAPPFYGSGTSSQPPYHDGGVPTYNDPNEVQFNQNNGNFSEPVAEDQNVDSFGAVETMSGATSSVAKVDMETANFLAPVRSETFEPQPTPAALVEAPFAYDASYKWLRGVLRFDAASGTWMMIYSDNPAADDEHAGRVVVLDSPALSEFKPQSVVLLQGEVDPDQSAAVGRAVYRVDAIEAVDLTMP